MSKLIVDNSPSGTREQSPVTPKDAVGGLTKQRKRKRGSFDGNVTVAECNRELEDLFQLYKEVSGGKLRVDENACDLRSGVACLLVGSPLPFSRLVEEIYETFKGREGVMLSSLRSTVLSVGERVMYGISSPDADVLEDVSEKCLWCWEAREMKLLPKMEHGILSIRRTIRKKIHERISSLLEILSTLSAAESSESCKSVPVKNASVKLGKTLNGNGIRSLFEKLKQKNDADILAEEAKLKEREKTRLECQIQKDNCQNRVKNEAKKEEIPHEKESDYNKLKKQQKEAERNKRRQEKEEAEAKKQSDIRKQARIMESFLKSKRNINDPDKPEHGSPLPNSLCKNEDLVKTTTRLMDCFFSEQRIPATDDLRKSLVFGWHKLNRRNTSCRWGVRRNPKIQLIKELKLQQSSPEADLFAKGTVSKTGPVASKRKLMQFDKSHRPAYYGTWRRKSDIVGPRHPFRKDATLDYDVYSDEEWEEEEPGESLSDCDLDIKETSEEENLEGEDENEDGFFVPDAFLSEDEVIQDYGFSAGVGGEAGISSSYNLQLEREDFQESLGNQKYLQDLTKKALRKEQPLVISNLMHEKAELAKSKDLNEILKVQVRCLQALCMRACPGGSIIHVPTNHYSSNEDQQVRCIQSNFSGISKTVESLHSKFPATPKSQLNNRVRVRSEFVENRWQVKEEILSGIGLSNSSDISTYRCYSYEEQRVCQSQSRNITPTATAASIPDCDLLDLVQCIQSNSSGMGKIVESLRRKFPATPKSQLNSRVRQISDFAENQWQVKKEILNRIGLPNTPDKGGRAKGVALYFPRCSVSPECEPGIDIRDTSSKCSLPPGSERTGNIHVSSPQPCSKMEAPPGDNTHIPQTDVHLTL